MPKQKTPAKPEAKKRARKKEKEKQFTQSMIIALVVGQKEGGVDEADDIVRRAKNLTRAAKDAGLL